MRASSAPFRERLTPSASIMLDIAATADGPATLAGRPILASSKEKLSDFVISMSLNGRTAATRARNVRKGIRISRSMGSAALALAYVANGRFDAFVQHRCSDFGMQDKKFLGDGVVTGHGLVDGRPVLKR